MWILSFAFTVEAFSQTKNDWKKYQASSSSAFHDTGILYRQSVLSQQECSVIKEDLLQLQLINEKGSIARNRIGAIIPGSTRQVFSDGTVSRLVQRLVGEDYILCDKIPVEVTCKLSCLL